MQAYATPESLMWFPGLAMMGFGGNGIQITSFHIRSAPLAHDVCMHVYILRTMYVCMYVTSAHVCAFVLENVYVKLLCLVNEFWYNKSIQSHWFTWHAYTYIHHTHTHIHLYIYIHKYVYWCVYNKSM